MTKKTTSLERATREREAAEGKHAEALNDVKNKAEYATSLRERNESGDTTVIGLQLLTADADVEAARGILAAVERDLKEARRVEAERLAQKVADEIAANFTAPMVQEEVERIRGVIVHALGDLVKLHEDRDTACDRAGQALADAGVPTGQYVGRIWYKGVSAGTSNRREIPGKFNVGIDGEPITRRIGYGDTAHEVQRLTQDILSEALRRAGMRWTTYGVQAA